MNLSSSPTMALYPDARIVTGCEDDPDEPGWVRLYVEQRGKGHFTPVGPEHAEQVRQAWQGSVSCHLFVRLDEGEHVYIEQPRPPSPVPPVTEEEK